MTHGVMHEALLSVEKLKELAKTSIEKDARQNSLEPWFEPETNETMPGHVIEGSGFGHYPDHRMH